jgi:hypothetical protein
MESAIQDLVNMRDIDSLYEVMTENDDFMYCLDAAEGLVMLGDKRGVEFLVDAAESNDEDISTIAQEILDSPQIRRKREELEVDRKRERQIIFEDARKRIQEGKKVFLYKTVYLPASHFISSDPSEDGDNVDALNEFGADGWEVAAFLGNPGGASPVTMSGKISGGYFLIKKEISPDEVSELDEL